MIIDKVEAYRTAEDKQKEAKLEQEKAEQLEALNNSDLSEAEKRAKYNDIATNFFFGMWAIEAEVENRYIQDHTNEELVDDARETINAIEMQDIKAEIIPEGIKVVSRINSTLTPPEWNQFFEKYDYQHVDFICSCISTQIKTLHDDDTALSQIARFIRIRLDDIYREESDFFLTAHSKKTRDIYYMSGKKGEIDVLYGDFTATLGNTTVVIEKYNDLKSKLGMTTSRLLNYINGIFTATINFKNAKKANTNPPISFTLKEYADAIGKPLNNDDQIKKFRKDTEKDLEILKKEEIKWDIISDKKRDKGSMWIIGSFNISTRLKGKEKENAKVTIFLENSFSETLINGHLSQTPKVLLRISPKEPNTYFICEKLSDHYSMDGNYSRGTHNRIKVKILLERTDLPSYKKIKKTGNRNWKQRIKKPFEKSLNDLIHKYSYLKNWRYAHAKGIPLTEKEIEDIKTYDEFSELYILFEPVNEPERKQLKTKAKSTKKDNEKNC